MRGVPSGDRHRVWVVSGRVRRRAMKTLMFAASLVLLGIGCSKAPAVRTAAPSFTAPSLAPTPPDPVTVVKQVTDTATETATQTRYRTGTQTQYLPSVTTKTDTRTATRTLTSTQTQTKTVTKTETVTDTVTQTVTDSSSP